jgi:hypothetical protein
VDGQRRLAGRLELDQLGVLGVVDRDGTSEAAGEGGGDGAEGLEVALLGPAHQAGRDEQRLALRRYACALELRGRRRERVLARVVQRGREREGRRLDDDRRAAAAGDECLERLACEREAEGIANRRAHVGHLVARRRWAEHDRFVWHVDDYQARAEEQRDALHYGMDRYSRRKVVRKPRRGQNRDASRFVTRQSVSIVA